MTSQKLLEEARKCANEIITWFHLPENPTEDALAIQHLAIRLAEFAASCLAGKEKEISEQQYLMDLATKHYEEYKATLKAREQEIERLKELINNPKEQNE